MTTIRTLLVSVGLLAITACPRRLRSVGPGLLLLLAAACSQVSERATAVAGVDGDHHLTVRAEGGRLWWSHRPWSEPHEVCRLPGDGPVMNLAIRPVMTGSGETFEITFDQDGAAWHGRIALDESDMLDTPVAFLRGTERVAEGSTLNGELARSGR